MRKLILIVAVATMSSSSCYANLSLASSDTMAAMAEQPKAQAAESRPAPVVKSHTAAKARKTHSLTHRDPIRVVYPHCL
jgi:hypothetical protein